MARAKRGRRAARPGFVKETVRRGDGRRFVFYWFKRKPRVKA